MLELRQRQRFITYFLSMVLCYCKVSLLYLHWYAHLESAVEQQRIIHAVIEMTYFITSTYFYRR